MQNNLKLKKLLCGIGCCIGLVLFVLGFIGQKIVSDGAKLPEGWMLSLITNHAALLMVLGLVLTAALVFLGNAFEFGEIRMTNYVPYLIIIPAFVFIILFVLYPMLDVVYLSLFKGNLINPTKAFLGLKNYSDILIVKTDFRAALGNTAVYTVSVVVFLIFFALLFAVWLFQERKLNDIAQTMLFSPYLIASVCSGFIFSWIMSKQEYGLFNSVLTALGFQPVKWLESSATAMPSIIFVVLWKNIGYYLLIVLAAMKSIPKEIYEAAKLDATPKIRQFFKITLPMISPQLFFLLITITISSFKVFDTIRVMTDGGPGNSTSVIAMYIYDYCICRMNSLGVGTAASVVLMVILMAMTVLYFKVVERKVHYQ